LTTLPYFIDLYLSMTKGTLQGTNRKRIRTSGFRTRMQKPSGKRIIKARRRKNRKRIAI